MQPTFVFKQEIGVPLKAKKWNTNIGKEQKPRMLKGVFGTKALVRGFRAAVEGMTEEVEERRSQSSRARFLLSIRGMR